MKQAPEIAPMCASRGTAVDDLWIVLGRIENSPVNSIYKLIHRKRAVLRALG